MGTVQATLNFVRCSTEFGLLWFRSADNFVTCSAIHRRFVINAVSSLLVWLKPLATPTIFLNVEDYGKITNTSGPTQGGGEDGS